MACRNIASSLLFPAAFKAATAQSTHAWSKPCFSCRLLAVRHVHTSRPSYALLDVLQKEIAFEEENRDSSSLNKVPSGWSLAWKPDDANVRLSKMKGDEKVEIVIKSDQRVVFDVPDSYEEEHPDEDEDEDNDHEGNTPVSINFDVDCKRGDRTLQFSVAFCTHNHLEEQPEIEQVALTDKHGTASTPYLGPPFLELDADIQQDFAGYLEGRGVNKELCQYLCRLVHDKEQQDYISWMKRVASFVSK